MKTQFTLWQKVANTPPTYLLVLFAWLLMPFNVSAVGVTSTPVANNFSASYDGAKVNLSWINSNKLNLVPSDVSSSNIKNGNISDKCSINSLSVSEQGVISASYYLEAEWYHVEFEMVMPGGQKSGIQSLLFDYSSKPSSINVYPYFMENSTWNTWVEMDGGNYVGPTQTEEQGFLTTPNNPFAVWFHDHNSNPFSGNNIHLIGFYLEAGAGVSKLTEDIQISNVYVNTSINWDALKIVRKIGGVPSSVSDGTVIDIAAGSTNSYIDNTVSNGNTYYYAVFAEINSVWTKIAESSEVVVGSVKEDVDLSLNSAEVTIPVGGLFTLTHTTADGYDGSISYSVAPDGVINFNESTGVITGIQMGGSATITVTASETSNFIGDTKTCTVNVTKNFVGDLSIEEAGGNVTLNWFYNLPISLETEVTQIANPIGNGGSYTSSNYGNGVRTIVYNCDGGTAFYAKDFKTPDAEHQTSNCKSFSVKLRGDEDSENNLRVIPYSWVFRPNWAAGDLVADPISIEDDWKEVVITPSYFYTPGNENAKGGASGFNYSDFPVGCIAFLPMSKNAVGNKQLQLKDAYFQLINTNGLTSSVSLRRKAGSAPTNAEDGDEVIYEGGLTTCVDNTSALDAGTYYYRVFATYGGYTYMSDAQSITISGTEDPELTLNEASTTLTVGGGTYTIEASTADGYNGTLEYSVLPATGVVNVTSDGVITAVGGGTATIQVIAPAEGDYRSASVNFTVKVYNTNPLVIPTDGTRLNASNVESCKGKVDFVIDDENQSVDISGKSTAEWRVKFVQGRYKARLAYGTPGHSVNVTMKIFDGDSELMIVGSEHHEDGSGEHRYSPSWSIDLTEIDEDKVYTVKVIDTYGDNTSHSCVGYIDFTLVAPIEISASIPTVLNAEKTYTSGLETATDVDFDGDATTPDESINLYNKKMDWVVKINPGYYNISLLYGAPEYSTRVSVALIDPEGVEPTRWFCPDQNDRNGHYYYTSGSQGEAYHSVGEARYNLYDITPDKSYILRVHDEYGNSNSLRVKDLTFTPIAPLNIPAVTRLNAANAVVSPGTENVTIDGEGTIECLDIAGLKEAAWYAYIAPGIYDIKLTYAAATGGTKVRFGIIDIASGDTVFVKQENKYSASNTTYTISALSQDFTTIGGGVYKIIVKDNYTSDGVPNTGSVPKVAHLDIERTLLTHTRSGLRIGDYGTICLPYAVAAADRTGAELFEIESWAENGTSMTMTQLNENENMIAGRPYIFQATANTATFSYYVDGEEAEAGTNNGLIGSYVEAEIPQNADNYIIYNNKLYMVNSANVWVGANRAYIHRGGEYSPAPANRRRVTMGLYGTQTTTDINQISTEQITNKVIRNGHLFILRGDKIYNAQGQLVQ